MSHAAEAQLATLVTSAEGGGYTLPPELLAAYATLVAVKALTIPTPPRLDPDTAAARLVTATADGKPVDLMALAAELADANLGKQRHDQAQNLVILAIEQAGNRAQNLAASMVEQVITAHLRPALEQVHAQAADTAAALDGYSIDDTHALLSAPSKVRAAYLKLPDLVARRAAIFKARRLMNTLGNRVAQHDANGLYGELKTPLALSPGWKPPMRIPPIPAPADPAARLLWVVGPEGATAGPWLPTIDEQDQAWLEEFGEAAKARQGQPGWAQVRG